MPFDTKGILGEQVNEIIKENYELYEDIFKLSEEINLYAQDIKYKLNIKSDDLQGIVAAALFIKILNTFQSIVILYKMGLDSQCRILTRAVLDSLFVLKCIVKDEKYLEMLKGSERKRREDFLRIINKNPHGVFNTLSNEINTNELYELCKNNGINKAKRIESKEWAEMSESYYEYYYAFNHLCNDVHVDLMNIEQYIKVDKDGNIEGFTVLPDIKDIKIILGHTANCAMIEAIVCISEYSNIKDMGKIEYFETRLYKL